MLKARDSAASPNRHKKSRPGFGFGAEAGAAGPGHRGSTLAADPRGQTNPYQVRTALNLFNRINFFARRSGLRRRARTTALRGSPPAPRTAPPAPRARPPARAAPP